MTAQPTEESDQTGERFAHPVYRHPDGERCIWVEGEWFIPYDAGGEGAACPRWHPGDAERRPHTRLRLDGTPATVEPLDPDAADNVAQALQAAGTGRAGHWPTVAGHLADEIARLRHIVATLTGSTDPTRKGGA